METKIKKICAKYDISPDDISIKEKSIAICEYGKAYGDGWSLFISSSGEYDGDIHKHSSMADNMMKCATEIAKETGKEVYISEERD